MSPEEAKLFRLYGKLPNKKDLLQNKLKVSLRCTPATAAPPRPLHPRATELTTHTAGAQVLRQRRLRPLQGRQGLGRWRHPGRPRAPQPREDPAHGPVHTRQRTDPYGRGHEGRQPVEGGRHFPPPRDKPEPRDLGCRLQRRRGAPDPAGLERLTPTMSHMRES